MGLPDAPTPMRSDTPRRTPTPAIPIPRSGTPNIASPRPVNPIPRIGSQSPRPSTPIQRCQTPAAYSTSPSVKSSLRQRTTTLSGVLTAEEARLAASKLRDEYIAPRNHSTPTTRERNFSMTAGGSLETKPKSFSSPPSRSYSGALFVPLRLCFCLILSQYHQCQRCHRSKWPFSSTGNYYPVRQTRPTVGSVSTSPIPPPA